MSRLSRFFRPARLALSAVAGAAVLSACTPYDGVSEFNDPYEAQNRKVHELNVALDRAFVRPSSNTYGQIVPEPVRRGVGNFASNLNLPGQVVNAVLQGRPEAAVQNTFRFLINTTLGVGGVFDPATSIGVADAPADFGQTLHVWGVRQGAYLELPLLGPTTERDISGKAVDMVLNPLNFVLKPPETSYVAGAQVFARFGDRYRYSDFVDSILYESADGYAQARLLYLQNRAYVLGSEQETEAYDPYFDPYAE